MQFAHILGWCVEFVRAGSIMADDVSNRPLLTPRGPNVGAAVDPTQERTPNDVLSLDAGVFVLLKHLFQESNPTKYANFVDSVLEAQQVRSKLEHTERFTDLGKLNFPIVVRF